MSVRLVRVRIVRLPESPIIGSEKPCVVDHESSFHRLPWSGPVGWLVGEGYSRENRAFIFHFHLATFNYHLWTTPKMLNATIIHFHNLSIIPMPTPHCVCGPSPSFYNQHLNKDTHHVLENNLVNLIGKFSSIGLACRDYELHMT